MTYTPGRPQLSKGIPPSQFRNSCRGLRSEIPGVSSCKLDETLTQMKEPCRPVSVLALVLEGNIMGVVSALRLIFVGVFLFQGNSQPPCLIFSGENTDHLLGVLVLLPSRSRECERGGKAEQNTPCLLLLLASPLSCRSLQVGSSSSTPLLSSPASVALVAAQLLLHPSLLQECLPPT